MKCKRHIKGLVLWSFPQWCFLVSASCSSIKSLYKRQVAALILKHINFILFPLYISLWLSVTILVSQNNKVWASQPDVMGLSPTLVLWMGTCDCRKKEKLHCSALRNTKHRFVSQRHNLLIRAFLSPAQCHTHTPDEWVRGPSRFGRWPLGLLGMSPFCLANDVLILGKLVELLRDTCGSSGCLMHVRVSLGQSTKSVWQKPWDFIQTGNLLKACSVFCLLSLSQARCC